MKLNRLMEITTILLNRRTVTARELADRFNVSTRTIYRDIDVLSGSGVPVYANKGANGGISLLENYTMNRAALLDKEKDSVIFALKVLQTTRCPEIDTVLNKLNGLFKSTASDWITADFTPWGSDPNEHDRFIDIKTAILQSKVIEIDYINSFNTKSHRHIEPFKLIFKSRAWYLWGYCLSKQDFRTFRISRIKNVRITDASFDRTAQHETQQALPSAEPTITYTHIVLQFTEQALYRLYDDYDDTMLTDNGDGTYTLELDFPEDEWVYGYILSFGSHVKVISPPHLREIIKAKAKAIAAFYDE